MVCNCSRRVVVFGRVKFSSSRLFISSLSETFNSSGCLFRSAINYDIWTKQKTSSTCTT